MRERELLLGPAATLEQLLGSRLVLPEIWCRDLALDVGELSCEASLVKDPSGARTRAR